MLAHVSLLLETLYDLYSILLRSKWRTTPVVEEVFAEGSGIVVAAGAVDAGEAAAGDAGPAAASPRTRK